MTTAVLPLQSTGIQYVSDAQGELQSVIVPNELWWALWQQFNHKSSVCTEFKSTHEICIPVEDSNGLTNN